MGYQEFSDLIYNSIDENRRKGREDYLRTLIKGAYDFLGRENASERGAVLFGKCLNSFLVCEDLNQNTKIIQELVKKDSQLLHKAKKELGIISQDLIGKYEDNLNTNK